MTGETPPQQPIVDPALRARLDAEPEVDVVVTFLAPVPADEQAALGLRPEGAGSARGRLTGSQVRALERRTDVGSVAEAPATTAHGWEAADEEGRTAPGGDEPSPAAPPGVDPELADLLRSQPDVPRRVAVWFRGAPPDAELADLGLIGTGDNPAVGQLDLDGVRALVRRPDVDRIVLRPDPQLF
jgi:hypothetical protein